MPLMFHLPPGISAKTLLKCSREGGLEVFRKIVFPWYSLGSSFLLHLWFGPLGLISHSGALQLPNQG